MKKRYLNSPTHVSYLWDLKKSTKNTLKIYTLLKREKSIYKVVMGLSQESV